MTVPSKYRNATAWRQSLNAHIRAQAAASGRSVQNLRRQVAYQRFLARVFSGGDGGWVLKGGVGLLMRTPSARATADVDLMHARQSAEHAITDLRAAVSLDLGDGLAFTLGEPVPLTGAMGMTIRVGVTISSTATVFERFSADIVTDRQIPSVIEQSTPDPIVALEELSELPPFALYPLPAQVADKVCATFARYQGGTRPSTRFRDLVDIVIIATTHSIDAGSLAQAVSAEARRRSMVLPERFSLPSEQWRAGYIREARTASLPPEFVDVAQAVVLTGALLDPILNGSRQVGTWDPDGRQWSHPA